MKYKYIKEVTNHNNTNLKLGNIYTIKKHDFGKKLYILTNYGYIMTEYAKNNCFKKIDG